jgi:hypothetical protein
MPVKTLEYWKKAACTLPPGPGLSINQSTQMMQTISDMTNQGKNRVEPASRQNPPMKTVEKRDQVQRAVRWTAPEYGHGTFA